MLADSNNGITDNTDIIPLGVGVGVGVGVPPPLLPLLPLQADNNSPVKTIIENKKLFNLKFLMIFSPIYIEIMYILLYHADNYYSILFIKLEKNKIDKDMQHG